MCALQAQNSRSKIDRVGNLIRLRQAQRKFKSQKIILDRYTDTQVANLKVLQSELTKLSKEQVLRNVTVV